MSSSIISKTVSASFSEASKRGKYIKPVPKPAATILVLGAGGLFGSRLCTLLQRIIPQQQFHNPNLSENNNNSNSSSNNKKTIRIAVAGRRSDVVKKYSIFWNEQLVTTNCKKNSYALEFVPVVVDAQKSDSAEFEKTFQELDPTIVVNATGLKKDDLIRLAKACVVKHGVHFIDFCDDFESVVALEKEMKSVTKLENKNGVPIVLCATGISTSPCVTGAIIDDVLQKKNTFFRKLLAEADTTATSTRSCSSSDSSTQQKTQQVAVPTVSSSRSSTSPSSSPSSSSVEIFLTPGMQTRNSSNSFEGQINIEQGTSTTRAILERIGQKFHVVRQNDDDDGAGAANMSSIRLVPGSFRSCRKLRLPWPVGSRLVSPMDSPDVLLNDRASNLSFFAGLQVPLLHRFVSRCPKSLVDKLLLKKQSVFLNGKFFRFAGALGNDVGSLLVKIETDRARHATESVLMIATKGAGTYIPALPAATLVVKLLQSTSFGNPTSPNSLLFHECQIRTSDATRGTENNLNNNNDSNNCSSNNKSPVVFTNGVHPLPGSASSFLVPTMQELQQVIDDAMLDVTIEQSKCLFQYCIGGTGSRALWNDKVHPVVRRFHELQGQNIRLEGFAESPVPSRFIDKLVHNVAGLQHSLPPNTPFDFTLNADSFSESWIRKYPTGAMFGEMYADEIVIGERKNRREVRCVAERMFGGFLTLYHILRVDEATGFIYYDTHKVTAFWGLIALPSMLAPSVKAIEGCCPVTGRFHFEVESVLPITRTKIRYTGTIRVVEHHESENVETTKKDESA